MPPVEIPVETVRISQQIPTPTVGRDVHYYDADPQLDDPDGRAPRCAKVVAVDHGEWLRLCILHPEYGVQWETVQITNHGTGPGQWTWPPRV